MSVADSQMFYEESAPEVCSLLVDDLGDVWLERYLAEVVPDGSGMVFDGDGIWLGDSRIPDRGQPRRTGEAFMMGVRYDSWISKPTVETD